MGRREESRDELRGKGGLLAYARHNYWRLVATALGAFGACMLFVAMFGRPRYEFFGQMKAVVGSALVILSTLQFRGERLDRGLALISVALALVLLFARFSREQWFYINAAMILVICVNVLRLWKNDVQRS